MLSLRGARKEARTPQPNAAETAAAALLEQRKAVLKWTSDALALELESIKQVRGRPLYCLPGLSASA